MALCDKCAAFKVFGEKCWFFWKEKKQCSQFKDSIESEPEFREE